MATSGKRRAAAAVEQVDGQDMPRLGFIAADPVDNRLSIDGAIFMSDAAHQRWCNLMLTSHGSKLDIDAYADLMTVFANEPLPEDHADSGHPGVRLGEHIPKGLRVWDDVYAGASGKDGAGWIASLVSKSSEKKEKWFNIRTVGSWRMAFLLARLQRETWERFGDKAPLTGSERGFLGDGIEDLSIPDATPQATQSAVDPTLSQVTPGRTPKRKKCDATSSPAKSVKRETFTAGPVLAPVANEHDEPDRCIDWQQINDQCRKSKESDRDKRRTIARDTGATNTGLPEPKTLAPSPSPSLQMPAPGTKMSAMLERIRAREAALKVA